MLYINIYDMIIYNIYIYVVVCPLITGTAAPKWRGH